MKLYDAFKHTISIRRVIWPNIGFMLSLINLEKKVFNVKESSISVLEYEKWDNFNIHEYNRINWKGDDENN